MASISDKTLDWLTLAATVDFGPDDDRHLVQWSRMTNRVGLCQVYSSDGRKIIMTMTFWIPMITKAEFNQIPWTELLAATDHHLIDRFAQVRVAA